MPQKFFYINELSIPFKGRHTGKQYNPAKPNKFQSKVFAMNCSGSNNWADFYFFKGSDESRPDNIKTNNYSALKLTEDVRYHYKNHILIIDNWFTAEDSIPRLKFRGMGTEGTMHVNNLHSDRIIAFKVSKTNQGDQ